MLAALLGLGYMVTQARHLELLWLVVLDRIAFVRVHLGVGEDPDDSREVHV